MYAGCGHLWMVTQTIKISGLKYSGCLVDLEFEMDLEMTWNLGEKKTENLEVCGSRFHTH